MALLRLWHLALQLLLPVMLMLSLPLQHPAQRAELQAVEVVMCMCMLM